MRSSILLSALLSIGGLAAAQSPSGTMLDLSCVEALVAIGHPHLAGVFSFVSEKDSPAALADLLVHDPKALKKYIKKLERDLKEAGGISTWDSKVVKFAMSIYASPLADTVEKPGKRLKQLDALARAQTMTLESITARRRRR